MEKIYQFLNKVIEWLLVTIFALLVVDVVWQVISRYAVGKPSSFTEEFARFALIWLTVLGAAYINGQKEGHLSMDFLLSKLPENKRHARQKVIQVIMAVFALIIMVIGGGNLVYTVYSIVPICGLIIIFFSIYNIKKLNFE